MRPFTFCGQKRTPINGHSQVVILEKPINRAKNCKIDKT